MHRLTQRESGVSQVRVGQCVELLRHLEDVVRVTLVSLESCSRCEVARPESMRVMCIGKEVVSLRRPSSIDFVQRVQIARRCRIEHIHVAALRLLYDVANPEQIRFEEVS